ncbi:TMEM165/GDT1 family protein [Paenalcaligenes niemegkensis]|uniref:TMEM165/GDT1 family protein n=1 Tax=Paenalcaligenes niemegkensis TaxID=2895469 RepID=UPI001EE916D5|nr:TMEM165/GDT1 family protein [Paenalcaligenes niemegkensis]MCQ9616499.1 TMEM165/GDT1 family protein [Paenalcaligenes niemegkensis]
MQALFVSTGIVALAEIGDKTQLLAFVLAARFKRPLPIIMGILVATLLNHGLAGALGSLLPSVFNPQVLTWILAVSFLLMAGWMMIPDKLDEEGLELPRYGVFVTTLIAFFIAEMGDKTQIATIALAAQYDAFWSVVIGTTLGMMLANVPAVLVGGRLANKLPVRLVHSIAACIFAILGLLALWQALRTTGWF